MVSIDGIPSVCSTSTKNCEYVVDSTKTPLVTSFSFSSNTLSFDLSTTDSSVTYTNKLFLIYYAGSQCKSVNSSTKTAV